MLKKKPVGKRAKQEMRRATCAHCGKEFDQTDLSAWSDIIMQHKPACSLECNKALGQVH